MPLQSLIVFALCRQAKNLKGTEKELEKRAAGAARGSGRKVEGVAEEVAEKETSLAAKLAAPAGLVIGLAIVLGGGYAFKDQLRGFIDYFIKVAEQWGPLGWEFDVLHLFFPSLKSSFFFGAALPRIYRQLRDSSPQNEKFGGEKGDAVGSQCGIFGLGVHSVTSIIIYDSEGLGHR